MNSDAENGFPWNIPNCMETSPNVPPFDVSTLFQLRLL